MKRDINIFVPFAKSDDEQRMVYGYCTSESLDSQGEIITKDAIRDAWDSYMEYANVREMHQPSAVGVTKEYSHDDQGTWIGVKVVDDRAWGFVKEGVYKGFSIGGRVLSKNKNIINKIVLAEISLVDRPANPDAKFSSYKMDSALVDRIELETNDAIMNKYVEIDGVKYQEDPNLPGEALKDEAGNPVVWSEESATEEVKEDVTEETEAPAEVTTETEEEKADKPADLSKVKMPATKKDTMGVITLASLLDHADYLEELFEMNGKDTAPLNTIKDTIKSLIATEAGESDMEEMAERAARTEDMTKVFGSELSKALAPVLEKVGGLVDEVSKLSKEVETIKSAKVSPRPKAAYAVGKSFENGDGVGRVDITAKHAELESLRKEIENLSAEMTGELKVNPGRSEEYRKRSEELYSKYRNCQREINDMMAGA